jgi:lysophospholipase L1-like esterase
MEGRLHPNDAGYMAMANAIDLSLFSQGEGEEQDVAP